MSRVYIGLGSNQGNQILNLKEAIRALMEDPSIQVIKVSSVYKTEPVGYEDQPWFYNAVAKLETTYEPVELLDKLLEIEMALGRVRNIRWGPRTVDLDILLIDDNVIDTDRLSVPHPRMLERDFVLVPLAELEENLEVHGIRISNFIQDNKSFKKVICTGTKL